jgi:hypothetical protein
MESLCEDTACCTVAILCYAYRELCHCTTLCTLLLCVATWSLLVLYCLETVHAEIGGSVRVVVMGSCGRLESCGGGVWLVGFQSMSKILLWEIVESTFRWLLLVYSV